MPEMPLPATFVQELREALHRLYSPGELQKSPLGSLFSVDARRNPMALQDVLLGAIEALKPKAGTPPQARAWRSYHALHSRYTEQFAQSEVAKALGLSPRQLLRSEVEALQDLAAYLWARYGLDAQPELVTQALGAGSPEPLADESSRTQELAWLRQSAPPGPLDVRDVIREALQTVRPVVEGLWVKVETNLDDPLPPAVVRRSPLRQALISLLMMAARAAPEGLVEIGATALSGTLAIRLRALPAAAAPGEHVLPADAEALAMAAELIEVAGGSLELQTDAVSIQISLPAQEQATVLFIEDNADTLLLYQRALAGTPYCFAGTRHPHEGLEMALQLRPRAIVMDVMLPDVDGWEMLGRLRAHPATREVPVIICTILPEEQLALALGAAGYARKPVSREALLGLLGQALGG